MKISVIAIGKTNFEFIKEGISEYEKRIKRYIPFEIKYIPDIKNTGSLSVEQIKEKEGVLIINQIKNEEIILLDDKGKQFTSEDFSKFLEQKFSSTAKGLVFVIGGAYGFSSKVYEKAKEKISLSKMTFSHQIVRLIFLEQLYRGLTIINGEPYHHS